MCAPSGRPTCSPTPTGDAADEPGASAAAAADQEQEQDEQQEAWTAWTVWTEEATVRRPRHASIDGCLSPIEHATKEAGMQADKTAVASSL